uniref:DNA-directed RNA polymerase III subunit n=1 Tax=Oryza nivara TaxID=4536 RepID=A0A0E0I3J2_ORYNI
MASRGRGRGRGRRGGGYGFDHPAKHTPHEDFPVNLLSSPLHSPLRHPHTSLHPFFPSPLVVAAECDFRHARGVIFFLGRFTGFGRRYIQDITLPEMTCARATMEEKALIQSTLKFEDFWKTSCYHLEEDVPKKKNDDKEIERYSDRKRKTHSKREALASYLILTPANFPVELVLSEDSQAVRSCVGIEAQDGDKKTEKDGDDEDEHEEEEVEEDENSDDDYNQNIEFDDDDDDWNQEEEAHEDYYD